MRRALSVIVPTYNRADLLRQTVQSILAQSMPPDEIIVIDDGSTDDTAQALASFGSAITCHRTANAGTVRARMHGLGVARHEWIALCDHDDLWLPDHVERAAALHDAVPGMNMSFSNFRVLRHDGPAARTKFDTAPAFYWDRLVARRLPQGWVMGPDFLGAMFRFTPIFPAALMFTRTLLARAGGLDPSRTGNRSEDTDFVCRCLLTATVGAVPEPTVLIRKHGANFSADDTMRLLDEVAIFAHLRDTRPEFAPYRATMEDEIRIRRVQAADEAFSRRDHAMVRRVVSELPPHQRPWRLRVKHAVARLPEPVGSRVNRLMQAASERTGSH